MQRGQPDDTQRSIKNGESGFERGYEAARGHGGSTGATGESGQTGQTGQTGRTGATGTRGERGTGISGPILIAIVSAIVAAGTFAFNFASQVSDIKALQERNFDAIQAGNIQRAVEHKDQCLALKTLDQDLRLHLIQSGIKPDRATRHDLNQVDC